MGSNNKSGCVRLPHLPNVWARVVTLLVLLFTVVTLAPTLITTLRRLTLSLLFVAADMTCVAQSQDCGVCEYCCWKDNGCPLSGIPNAYITCPEAARLTNVYGPAKSAVDSTAIRFRETGTFKRATSSLILSKTPDLSLGEIRLHKFLRLLRHMGNAPWANVNFAINNMILNRLTASHLHLITGKDEFLSAPKAKLYTAISPKINLQDAQNLIWITNRQNGKTGILIFLCF